MSLPRTSRRTRAAVPVLALAIGLLLMACTPDQVSDYVKSIATVSIFGNRTPAVVADSDTRAVELGVRFRASTNGYVTGVRFYKSAQNTGQHLGSLWSKDGKLLARATFNAETASGWQSVTFDAPVTVTAGTTYVASYHTNVGRYSADSNFFATATTSGPLTALADNQDGRNSVYAYSGSSTFPTSSWNKVNYWVDVMFTDGNDNATTTTKAPTTTAAPTTTKAPTTTAAPTTTKAPTTTTTVPPTGSTNPPPQTGYPSASNTGWARTGVTLTPYTGSTTITTAGTVIDGKDITSCVYVNAANVTIKRSRIRCSGNFGINQGSGGGGLLVQDTEITSTSNTQLIDRAIQLNTRATFERVYAWNTQRGVALIGDNITITDSYVGKNSNGTEAHSSAIGAWGGADNIILRHNTLRTEANTNASSSISIYPESAPNTNWTVDDNLLASGGGYVLYAGYTPSLGERANTGIVFKNNKISTDNYVNGGQYGVVASWSSNNTWSNNTWYDLRPTSGSYTNKNGQQVAL